MSNVVNPVLLPQKADDGVYEFRWANISTSTILTAVCPERDAGVFVHALVSAPAGTILLAEADRQTVEQYLRTWSEITGQVARLVPIATQALEAIIEPVMPSFGREMAENFQYYRDFTYTGGDPAVKYPAELGIDRSSLTTFRGFLSELDWNALLSDSSSVVR